MTPEEFKTRLAESVAGRHLRTHVTGPDAWPALETKLLNAFATIGEASSESFARLSRGWSVAVGFMLAFLLNIDSIDLLNSYLTDPALRAQVVEHSDELLNPTQATGETEPTRSPDGIRVALEARMLQVNTAARDM